MRFPGAVAIAAAALLLSGCAAAATPRATVTVTVAPPAPTLKPGDAAAWDLSAVCSAESEILTVDTWRRHQSAAHLLSASQSSAAAQAVAVQVLDLGMTPVPASVQEDVSTLTRAAGSLDHPSIDLTAPAAARAQQHIIDTCQSNGLTVGVTAQGG